MIARSIIEETLSSVHDSHLSVHQLHKKLVNTLNENNLKRLASLVECMTWLGPEYHQRNEFCRDLTNILHLFDEITGKQ
ncbi:hypothetical protein POW02_20940 [Enterobacter asburiae]|uniref:hypothetical protein n=1 Tax=Enterobacter asburiae TaxID=61645 RepID=UPI002FFB460D